MLFRSIRPSDISAAVETAVHNVIARKAAIAVNSITNTAPNPAKSPFFTAAPEFSPFLRELPEPVVRETTGRRREAEQLRLF